MKINENKRKLMKMYNMKVSSLVKHLEYQFFLSSFYTQFFQVKVVEKLSNQNVSHELIKKTSRTK